jgi:hypothetical protein
MSPARWFALLLGLSISVLVASGQSNDQSSAELQAYVTHVASPSDFEVDGLHVLMTPKTILQSGQGDATHPVSTIAPYLGQLARVFGPVDRKALTVKAVRIVLMQPRPYVVSGSAIIDLVPGAPPSTHRLRADGRLLEISQSVLDHPATLPAGSTPPAAVSDLRTNVWIDYHGMRRPDGVVALDQATFAENKVVNAEQKLRDKQNYDPAAVAEDSHQSTASKMFKGIDYKQIPPYKDAQQQARIDRIGRSLIPGFQRQLAASDPTRIDFRFQLVDEPKWHDAITLPSGIILVPRQIVTRLTDDSELAAVLADNIAAALEKQTWRQTGSRHQLTAADLAGAAAGVFIPGAGLATDLAVGGIAHHMLTLAERQSGRVALALMFDTGYDIDLAPEAWWTLATKQGRDPHGASPPPRATNQFDELGTTWQPGNRAALQAQPTKELAQLPDQP